jgi:hypothetical protein
VIWLNRFHCFSVLSLLLFTAVGCGPPASYHLSGTVEHDGKPMPFVQLTFDPGNGNRPPIAVADKNGNFEVSTGSLDGLPPGEYIVMVEDPAAAAGGRTVEKSDPLFASYQYVCERYSPQNSDLKYKADAARSGYVLKLDTHDYSKPKVKLTETENTTDVPDKKK